MLDSILSHLEMLLGLGHNFQYKGRILYALSPSYRAWLGVYVYLIELLLQYLFLRLFDASIPFRRCLIQQIYIAFHEQYLNDFKWL